jgi:hypothetical protein
MGGEGERSLNHLDIIARAVDSRPTTIKFMRRRTRKRERDREGTIEAMQFCIFTLIQSIVPSVLRYSPYSNNLHGPSIQQNKEERERLRATAVQIKATVKVDVE